MPRLHIHDFDHDDALELIDNQTRPRRRSPRAETAPRFRPRQRRNECEPFKCGRCWSFIQPPATGSRYRNHCPACLTSRHVDARRPGDRACPCQALMPAVGTYFRPDGEQMLVHRCNGCAAERTNRIAADDNPVALVRLVPVAPPGPAAAPADDAAIA
ncbi:MAG: RNHCP domain-containing protein [Chloroflexota bacterium]|nr:RNHCP domain-containing protein [Chloroflexota bacterium]